MTITAPKPTTRKDGGPKSTKATSRGDRTYDAIVIATHHKAYDWQLIADNAKLIVDTRNATRDVSGKRDHIVRA